MKNTIFTNHWFKLFGVAVCLVSLLAVPKSGICDSRDDQPEDSRTWELKHRQDTAIREVNEARRADIKKAEAVKRNRYMEELGYVPKRNLLSDEELAEIENQRAKREKAVRARFDYEIKRAESLNTKQAIEPQTKVKSSKKRAVSPWSKPAKKSLRGLMTGIVFYNDSGAALVDGEVIRQNDILHGVKVLRIMPNYVEFEKSGKKWRQLVGQRPPTSWGFKGDK